MKIIIDRFEEDFAVIELDNGTTINVPKLLFKNGKEGDVFNIEFNSTETEKRKDKITNIINNLFID